MMILTPPARTTLQVVLGERSYPIVIGPQLLNDTSLLGAVLPQRRIALVTNETLMPIYGEPLSRRLADADISVLPIVLPDGEAFKDWAALNRIFDALLAHGCDRKTTLVALGGGVIGDITGFAAATYQRGVPFIQIPTTLLAQVDSSIGGKTAINHPLGKNMIGAFYQPQLVLADTDTLATLPDREFRSGLAEVLKYGLILDAVFFEWLESNIDALLKRDGTALAYAIRRSCEIKAQVVAADEHETVATGGRALLNLGHTFGHAIESALGYGTWLHGEAVGCGIALAAALSMELGMLDATAFGRTTGLIERAGLGARLPGTITPDEMLEHIGRDKKNEAGVIRLILLKRIGEAVVDGTISASRIRDFLGRSMR
ncbi:MAG: 3-dehydroquinate synthase [Betaproteobacteria bacterium]